MSQWWLIYNKSVDFTDLCVKKEGNSDTVVMKENI